MGFTIPNPPAGYVDQTEPDQVDFEVLAAGPAGYGVLSGCAVTAQGSPNMTLAVAAGLIVAGTARAAVTAGNVTITTAHATLGRFDLVVVSSSGTKSVTAGTASTNPMFPSPGSNVVLAAVYVPAAAASIGSASIIDKRVSLVDLAVSATNLQTGSTYTCTMSDAGGVVARSNASANTVTIPTNSSVPYPLGTILAFEQHGAGQTTINGAGTQLRSRGGLLALAGQWAAASARKIGTDEWLITGDLA